MGKNKKKNLKRVGGQGHACLKIFCHLKFYKNEKKKKVLDYIVPLPTLVYNFIFFFFSINIKVFLNRAL